MLAGYFPTLMAVPALLVAVRIGELVTGGDVGGDAVVAAAQVLDEGVTGAENPR